MPSREALPLAKPPAASALAPPSKAASPDPGEHVACTHSRSAAVQQRQAAHLREFLQWCAQHHYAAVPTYRTTVLAYLRDRAGHAGIEGLYQRALLINRLNLHCGYGPVASGLQIGATITQGRRARGTAKAWPR